MRIHLAVAVVGWSLLGACRAPALVVDTRKLELVATMQEQFARSVVAEKAAVLAATDEESRRFADESKAAAARVKQARDELAPLVTAPQKERLDAFDAAWARVVAIDAKLLPLAVENTNLKAAHLSQTTAARALDAVLAGLEQAGAEERDPARQRTLRQASVAALRIQALHAPHIASPDDAEMTALEARMAEHEAVVGHALAQRWPKAAAPALAQATAAWTEYREVTKKVVELSRANTNVVSLGLSVHEKADAERACDDALRALAARLREAPRATR